MKRLAWGRASLVGTTVVMTLAFAEPGATADVLSYSLSLHGSLPGSSKDEVVRLRFVGANARAAVDASDLFGRVEYKDLYPGIGLAFYGSSDHRLACDLVLEPGADLTRIRVRVDGGRELRVDQEGNLLVDTAQGTLVQRAPIVYRDVLGTRHALPGRYVRRGKHEVGVEVEG